MARHGVVFQKTPRDINRFRRSPDMPVISHVELHRDELVADWDLAASGELPYKIDPL